MPFSVSQRDFQTVRKWYWPAPYQRVLGRRLLADLWSKGTPLSSLLVVLAVHCKPDHGSEWSQHADLWGEKIATLSGHVRQTASSGIGQLVKLGIVSSEARVSGARPHVPLRRYRVASWLYAKKGEPYVSIDAVPLIYGTAPGSTLPWAEMEAASHRHSHLTELFLRPPVRHAARFAEVIAQNNHLREDGEAMETLRKRLNPDPLGYAEMMEHSGMSRSQLVEVRRWRRDRADNNAIRLLSA